MIFLILVLINKALARVLLKITVSEVMINIVEEFKVFFSPRKNCMNLSELVFQKL